MTPPKTIDGARVIEWVWSGLSPFGVLYFSSSAAGVDIFGLAICQYEGSDVIYRFSCDKHWETAQDFDYSTITEAKKYFPNNIKCESELD